MLLKIMFSQNLFVPIFFNILCYPIELVQLKTVYKFETFIPCLGENFESLKNKKYFFLFDPESVLL